MLFSMSKARVKQHDIAERAGVSVSTVSRVLNNVPSISEDVRQHVLSVATDLGYQVPRFKPQASLRNVSLFTTLSRALDPFHADVISGIEVECLRQGIKLTFAGIEEGADGGSFVLAKIKQTSADGILLLSVDDQALIEEVLALGLPVVTINTDSPDLPVDAFLPDNFSGALRLMRHLIAHGHRRILHVTYLQRRTLRRRHDAYRAALDEAGIDYDSGLVVDLTGHHKSAYVWMRDRLAASHADFTAIFCVNDVAAIEILHALSEAGCRIPKDVSVVGYDDTPASAFLTPPLTTVHIDRRELSGLAVRRLLERAAEPALNPIRVELWSQLVQRRSVAKARV